MVWLLVRPGDDSMNKLKELDVLYNKWRLEMRLYCRVENVGYRIFVIGKLDVLISRCVAP